MDEHQHGDCRGRDPDRRSHRVRRRSGPSASPQGGGQPAAGATGAGSPGGGQNGRAPGAPRAGFRVGPIPVQAVIIHIGPLKTGNDTAGSVVPVTLSSVASQVAGVVSAVPRQAGDWVRTGATVVQLDDTQLKLAVQTAQSNLAIARINYQIGQDNTDQSNPKLQLQVQSAESALASAQKNYDSTKALLDIGGSPCVPAGHGQRASCSRHRRTWRPRRPRSTRTRSRIRRPSRS